MAKTDVASTVTGVVWKVEVAKGDRVAEGDAMIVVESMKMEIPVVAPANGVVADLLVGEEDMVDEGQSVAVIET